MSHATLIYPHQLFTPEEHPALATGRPVYLIEEPLLLTHNAIHRQRLILHKLSLDAYERELIAAGYTLTRLTIHDHPRTDDIWSRLKADGVSDIHVADTTDDYLERALTQRAVPTRHWYESPLFYLPRQEAIDRYHNSKRHMARFYSQLRTDYNILLDPDGTPRGGRWSFDDENRRKLPRGITLPEDITCYGNQETAAAISWAESVPAEQYGEPGCWLPYTHHGATAWLDAFLAERFAEFGPYEDALSTSHVRVFHSALSPLLNIGLLTPRQVLTTILDHADTHAIPCNSLEGMVRQLVGWREFMRAAYEADGRVMRTSNVFGHARDLPTGMWDGSTGVLPVDHVITTARTYGYTHHIERLMVAGNFLLLTHTDPTAVYRWFMGMYIDAYDWVMVPNVYGMSQFADGGSFTTKPYISGANYLRKMSDYPPGEWESLWTALYWHFIHEHQELFAANHRLAMMPRLLARMTPETRNGHLTRACDFLASQV